MAADHQAQDAQSDDLFGRWLAHHEQQSGDGDTTEQDVTDHDPPPRASRRLPAAAVASSAVENDPMIGTRLLPPSSFGARRPAPNAPAPPSGATEPEPAKGWEPIVMASARKKTEKTDTRSAPRPPEQPSRFQRLKARFVDPKEPTPEPEAATAPVAPASARAPLPTRTPAPEAARSIEETIRAAVPEHQSARHVDAPVEPAGERPVERSQPVPAPVTTVVETVEPEEVAAPTPVRAFIDVTPKHAAVRDPEPESVLPPLVDREPVVAESVVAEAEPELTVEPDVEPVVEPDVGSVVESRVNVDPEPVVQVEPEPVAYVEPDPHPEPVAVVEPEPDPDPEPEPEAETVAVVDPEPEPVAAEEPPAEPAGRRSFLGRSLRAPQQPKPPKEPKLPKEPKVRRSARPGTGDAARDLVAAKARARAAEPAPKPAPEVEAEPEVGAVAVEAPPEPTAAPAPRKVSKHDQVATEMPGVYLFKQKKTSRRLLTIALLGGLGVSAYFVKTAIDTKETASMGLAAIVLLATAMVWAIRAGAAPTRLEVHHGQLEVKRQGERYVFDLASSYTRIEVRGRPGRRGWKVLFPRRGMAPFAVDATMVDPDDFMRVLRFFRPDLVIQ